MSRRSSPQSESDVAIYAEIGKLIRKERKALGFSQAELAQEVNLVRASINNIEQGRQCASIHMLYRIARALAVPVMALLPEDIDKLEDIADSGIGSSLCEC